MSKNLRIKAWKPVAPQDPANTDELLLKISSAINCIYSLTGIIMFEDVYQSAYKLVHINQGEQAYQLVTGLIENRIMQTTTDVSSLEFLEDIHKTWLSNKMSLSTISGIMLYLENTYVKERGKDSFYNYGLKLFKEFIYDKSDIGCHLTQLLVEEALKNKLNSTLDKNIIRSITGMLCELGLGSMSIYELIFESPFLIRSNEFYKCEAETMLKSTKISQYLRHVQYRLHQEREFCQSVTHVYTLDKILGLVDQCFILSYSTAIVGNNNLNDLILSQDFESLKLLYSLFIRTPKCINDLADELSKYTRKEINNILNDQANIKKPLNTIKGLIDLISKLKFIGKECFQFNRVLENVVKVAFEDIINQTNRVCIYFTIYLDNFLKKDVKFVSDSEIDVQILKLMDLFISIKNKDIFEIKYKEFLALRLLEEKSLSIEAEKIIVKYLKQECGLNYVNKIDGMLKDINSEVKYEERQNFEARVLTANFWPQEKLFQIQMPQELSKHCSEFLLRYSQANFGKRLTWRFEYGSAQINAKLGDTMKEYRLIGSIYQACILLIFNDREKMTTKDVFNELKGSNKEITKHILGLAKARVLTKTSKGKVLNIDDVLGINEKYNNKIIRVQLEVVSGESEEATKETIDESVIEDERRFFIEAAIVKIMKTRKTLDHNLLIAEVIKFCDKFSPEIKLIKTRIESLILKEFLRRDEKTSSIYHYIA